jgi:hypothetical protein
VMGGIGSGKSKLITSELAPRHADAVVIDADRLWSEIPEYRGWRRRTGKQRVIARMRKCATSETRLWQRLRYGNWTSFWRFQEANIWRKWLAFWRMTAMKSQWIAWTVRRKKRGSGSRSGRMPTQQRKTTFGALRSDLSFLTSSITKTWM